MLVQLDGAVLGFSNRQLAKLHAGAGNDAAPRPARLIVQTALVQLAGERRQVRFVDVEQDDVLRVGGAQSPAAVGGRKLREPRQFIARSAPAEQRDADIKLIALALAMDAEVCAVTLGDRLGFWLFGAAEPVTEPRFDGFAQARHLPLLDQELQARL